MWLISSYKICIYRLDQFYKRRKNCRNISKIIRYA